jgi:hypothetical protein
MRQKQGPLRTTVGLCPSPSSAAAGAFGAGAFAAAPPLLLAAPCAALPACRPSPPPRLLSARDSRLGRLLPSVAELLLALVAAAGAICSACAGLLT